ncbi:MAG: sigma-70 family RNA polymerase sigma factor [Desulforegulaceae bacterium]|jgi:RNA polymerase sigma-70 factor (ECF subfamily)|nr:sigma-70 family RNA polymerase sigma factor [Desulforegulaceae bacterium]
MAFFKSLKKYSDNDLINLILLSDSKAFEELVSRYETQLYSFCIYIIKDETEAKDMVQETYLKFYKNISNFDPEKKVKAFLFKIANNLCIDFLRKKKPVYYDNLPETDFFENPVDILCKNQEEKILYLSIEKLPELYKKVLLLKYKADLKYSEIGEILGKTENSIEALLVRAKKKLREILDNSDFQD